MSSSPPSPIPHHLENEPTWSKSEKTIAPTAFDVAPGRELHEVIQEVKRVASEIQESSELWDLEHYLTERRRQIDRKYDYRYSQLAGVWKPLVRKSTQ
jgi:photoprotection regulator FRP-like protein